VLRVVSSVVESCPSDASGLKAAQAALVVKSCPSGASC